MIRVADIDIFYISYDEPNAERNWADLRNKAPWAKRVHGVKGFDSAHKACAQASDTERFITVDGDNIVYETFFDMVMKLSEQQTRTIYSWNSVNIINGLIYGNGGIKCWTREFVMALRSHEMAKTKRAQVDFCWEDDYAHMTEVYSDTHCNASPYQAFRTGYREGVKMCLDNGIRVEIDRFWQAIHRGNLERLLVWCSVGADVENGLWAIFGARLGCYNTLLSKMAHTSIRDYTWFRGYFDGLARAINSTADPETTLMDRIELIGNHLRGRVGLAVEDLDAKASRLYKAMRNGGRAV